MSSHGSRLQLPGFFGTEGAHQSQIASATASTNRQQGHITPNGDRQTAVQTLRHAGRRESKNPLGKLDTGDQARCSGFLLPSSPPTWVHVSSGNECGQPHGGQSRASRTAGARAVFVRSVSTCPKVLRHGCVWWRFWWNRGPLFMPAEGSAYITHVRVHKSTCTRVRTIPGRMGWSYLLSALQHCAA